MTQQRTSTTTSWTTGVTTRMPFRPSTLSPTPTPQGAPAMPSMLPRVQKSLRVATLTGQPAYGYNFNHTLSYPWLIHNDKPFPGASRLAGYGATHSAELHFVWANLDKPSP